MSLLDRLRQAVYRIIMLNALCKTNVQQTDHGSGGASDQVQSRGGRCGYNYLYDPRHNEAMADCIEFIKKTGITAEENRDSNASGGSIDAASELVFTVPDLISGLHLTINTLHNLSSDAPGAFVFASRAVWDFEKPICIGYGGDQEEEAIRRIAQMVEVDEECYRAMLASN
ncbi:hypothetical protein RHSIM_Rhsim10G0212800 [Rhododendron simsii]|uniref:Uncharacterized protein n=1 Tax=Rhododendron simsii TaxID=118357 RepID=A0A834G8T1_RHOSS|nr:hypothetical protein RHSIM_Rhsim10G0212800 [Rhododendron simsii]